MTRKEDRAEDSGKGMQASATFKISTSDSTGVQITSCLLNGENYLTWSRAMKVALTAKGKLGFVEGKVPKPPAEDPNLENWEMCNSLVLAWIFNGLEKELQPSAAYATEAKTLWDDLKERYSQGNEMRIYQLKSDISLYKQGGKTVQRYYSGIKTLWDELENYIESLGCSCNAAARYVAQREKEKIYQFLMGLDDEFRSVRSDILRIEPLPTLSRVYQMISEEEKQHAVVRSRDAARTPDGGSELGAFAARTLSKNRQGQRWTSEGRPICDHWQWSGGRLTAANATHELATPGGVGLNSSGHSKGYPGHPANVAHEGRATSIGGSSSLGLSNAQFVTLLSMIATHEGRDEPLVGNDNFIFVKEGDWIIDTGASKHMTSCENNLSNLRLIDDELSIYIPNGNSIRATSVGNVRLGDSFILQDVLFVLEFNCNLISVGQLSREMDCLVTFLPDLCLIQDRVSKRTVGLGELQRGVYYLRWVASSALACQALGVGSGDIWHKRLGHPSSGITIKEIDFDSSFLKNKNCDASLPTRFWGESVATTAHLINIMPTQVLKGKSPYEVLFQRKLNYSNLRFCESEFPYEKIGRLKMNAGNPLFFQTWAETNVDGEGELNENWDNREGNRDGEERGQLNTLGSTAEGEGRALDGLTEQRGESPQSRGPSGLAERATQDALSSPHQSGSSGLNLSSPIPVQRLQPEGQYDLGWQAENTQGGTAEQARNQENVISRRSGREIVAPKHLRDFVDHKNKEFVTHIATHYPPYSPIPPKSSGTPYPIEAYLARTNSPNFDLFYMAAIDSDTEPKTYREAVRDPRWRTAMAEEIRALELNETWTLETLPYGKRPIDCKWVYKIKRRADGSIERYKARLVAKGFTQVEGIDFHETFAPVAKLVTVRCLLTVAVARGWEMHQMDVQNAFLHGNLDEEVYMRLPPGFFSRRKEVVCRLRKSLYGLRQASRNWYSKFADALRGYGFHQSDADHSLFIYSRGEVFLGVLVYVDDLIVVGNSSAHCASFKKYLHQCFRIKDLGPLKYFLGIE
ncbi:hypothetical protein CRG98_000259, partial [Punica granatum]